jgi:aspartyl-tRNA(Asn)/glutamyl-tRNA(Gln) amidotransferase subunit A
MTTLHQLSAVSLLAAYRAKTLSPVEVTQAVLAHIERYEPRLCATYLLDPAAALAQAQASEQRWLAGQPQGLLDGVPVTIKENIATRGQPMPLGVRATDHSPRAADGPPAARLREAGAVLICKTTMPDYGMLSSGLSSFHKLARNPWDLSKTPGGSSAGAGAAAAAGYGPLHIGTDIGGSIRLPAGWCGVFGLKPSLGRVPIEPPYMGRAAGPMTRSVPDAALMMQVLSQPDVRDSMSLPPQQIDWHALQAGDAALGRLKGLKIGLLLHAGCGLPVEPQLVAAVQRAAQLFEQAGAQVRTMQSFLTPAMLSGTDHFWRMRSYLDLQNLTAPQKASVLPYIQAWADSAADMTGAQVFAAYSQTHITRLATVQACTPFDYVISPTAPVAAFDAHLPSPTNDPLRPLEHIAFTMPFNLSEQPAASINCGYTDTGLPIGLQIAGQRFDDVGVLQVARAFELIRDAQRAWPCG